MGGFESHHLHNDVGSTTINTGKFKTKRKMTTLDDLLTPEQVAFINRSAHAHLLDKDVDTITFFELRVIAAIINKTEYGFESDLHKLITLLLA